MPRYLKSWFWLALIPVLLVLLFAPKKHNAAPAVLHESHVSQMSHVSQAETPKPSPIPLGVKIQTAMNTTCQQGCALKWCKRAKCGNKGDNTCKAGYCRGCWKQAKPQSPA